MTAEEIVQVARDKVGVRLPLNSAQLRDLDLLGRFRDVLALSVAADLARAAGDELAAQRLRDKASALAI